jgi:hypothetical protein
MSFLLSVGAETGVVVAEVLEAVVQMNVGCVQGEIGVVVGDGGRDECVFKGGGGQSNWRRAGFSTNPGDMRAQCLEGVDEIAVARRGIDGFVEAADQGVVAVDLLIRHGGVEQRSVPGVKVAGIAAEDFRIGVARSEPGRLRFETGPHLVERIDVAVRDVGDDQALSPPIVEQTLGDQAAKRFANRRAGNAQTLGLLDFEQRAAGAERALEDLRSQLFVGTGSCA